MATAFVVTETTTQITNVYQWTRFPKTRTAPSTILRILAKSVPRVTMQMEGGASPCKTWSPIALSIFKKLVRFVRKATKKDPLGPNATVSPLRKIVKDTQNWNVSNVGSVISTVGTCISTIFWGTMTTWCYNWSIGENFPRECPRSSTLRLVRD